MQDKMRYILKLLIVVLLNICVIAIAGHSRNVSQRRESVPALSKVGSRGDEVRLIQEKLRASGYNLRAVDGIFEESTSAALRKFQAEHGLTIDGYAGTATLRALGLAGSSGTGVADSDYYLLARLISTESKGEPYTGQVAVGAVILNRLQHPSFPDSIAGVAYQPGAFTTMADSQTDQTVEQSAYRAAKDALNGLDPSGGALYYYDSEKSANEWLSSRPVIKIIGKRHFCK